MNVPLLKINNSKSIILLLSLQVVSKINKPLPYHTILPIKMEHQNSLNPNSVHFVKQFQTNLLRFIAGKICEGFPQVNYRISFPALSNSDTEDRASWQQFQ